MGGYLIYHPARWVSEFGAVKVYHDSTYGNQDPYVWNRRFLHTYCHITQMRPEVGDVNFWVSGDTFPNFSRLSCDLVFRVEEKVYWAEANRISREDGLVDSEEAFNDHYQWGMYQHILKRRQRYTLKAEAEGSFQAQDGEGDLIDLVPLLGELGIGLEELRAGMKAGFNARPFQLGEMGEKLYERLADKAVVKLRGEELEAIRRGNRTLASPGPQG